jgi:RNA polymerase sigma-70 factor (ECF subfamily)
MSGRVLLLDPLFSLAPKGRSGGVVRSLFVSGAERGGRPAAPAQDADPEDFRRLMLPHLDAAYAFARYLCRDATVAEDLVQDAFLRAYRGFHGYRGGEPKSWLFAIVRSSFMEWARTQRRWDSLASDEAAEDIADEAATAEAILMRQSDDTAVRRALDGLPDPFREALVLRELQDMSYREIADITQVPIGTVMSRLARARRLLAVALAEEGVR